MPVLLLSCRMLKVYKNSWAVLCNYTFARLQFSKLPISESASLLSPSSTLLLSSSLTRASRLGSNRPHWQKGQTFWWIPGVCFSSFSSRSFCRRLQKMIIVRCEMINSWNHYFLVRSRCSSWIRNLFLVKGIISISQMVIQMVIKEYTWHNSYDSLLDGGYIFHQEVVYPCVVFVVSGETLL